MLKYQFLKILKREFREWYGLLSCSEIIQNTALVCAIDKVENHKDFMRIPA